MFLVNCDMMTLFYLRVNGLSGMLGCAIVVGEISVVPLLLQDGSPPQSAYLSSCMIHNKAQNWHGKGKCGLSTQPIRKLTIIAMQNTTRAIFERHTGRNLRSFDRVFLILRFAFLAKNTLLQTSAVFTMDEINHIENQEFLCHAPQWLSGYRFQQYNVVSNRRISVRLFLLILFYLTRYKQFTFSKAPHPIARQPNFVQILLFALRIFFLGQSFVSSCQCTCVCVCLNNNVVHVRDCDFLHPLAFNSVQP